VVILFAAQIATLIGFTHRAKIELPLAPVLGLAFLTFRPFFSGYVFACWSLASLYTRRVGDPTNSDRQQRDARPNPQRDAAFEILITRTFY
jgi:hypothetical protein